MAMEPRLSCRELLDFLAAYLDGELPPSVRLGFEAHLGVCPDCVAYLDGYRETIRLERDAHGVAEEACGEMPEDLVRAIVASRRG
jgi:anti-sigma factor RsiW